MVGIERLVPYISTEWESYAGQERWLELDATLVFVDISGFTNLSERLARRGRIGAEELTDVLNHVFGSMLELAYARRGELLKFGGDALLLMFRGPDHVHHGCDAAVEMRAALRRASEVQTSAGRVSLRMSTGVHTGPVGLFLVGESHHELVVAGPIASETTRLEALADAGEIVVSREVHAALGRDGGNRPKGEGFVLPWRTPRLDPIGPQPRPPIDMDRVESFIPVAIRSTLGDGQIESEHRMATIGFVKFRGTDGLLARAGPEALTGALHELVSVTQAAADEEGVTFLNADVDADGGKLILVTGVPRTQDDDEGRMLRAVRAVVEARPSLSIRVGVNRGHVFAGEIGMAFRSTYTIMGDAVNLAARLMAAAPAGSVYASPSALERAHTLFEAAPLEPFLVKGKAGLVRAFAVGVEIGDRDAGSRDQLPFGGRRDELHRVCSALETDLDGSGVPVVVTGATGIGKSRLVKEAVALIPRAAVFKIQAEPYGTTSPYRAFRDTARRMLGVKRADRVTMADTIRHTVATVSPHLLPLAPLLGQLAHVDMDPTPEVEAIEPRFVPDRLADVVVEMLDATLESRTVLVVEDAHWMDEASAHLLGRLARATGPRSWAMVVTRRPDPTGFTPIHSVSVDLGPLSDEAVADMVVDATAAAPLRPQETDALVQRVGGSPLFLEEMLDLMHASSTLADLPESLEAVLGASIDSLAPLPRLVVRLASVLGQSFPTSVFDELLVSEGIAMDQATRAVLAEYLEVEGPDRMQFRHAMVRDVAYRGLAYQRRRALHLQVAQIIEAGAGDGLSNLSGLLAVHFAEGQHHAMAWHYARIEAERAKRLHANVDAAAQYERAMHAARWVDDITDHERSDVLRNLGDVYVRSGVFDRALECYTRSLRFVGDEIVTQIELLLRRAVVRRRSSAYGAALRETTRGLRLVDKLAGADAIRARGRLHAERGSIRRWQQQPREVVAWARLAEADARESEDRETLARALDLIDWARRMTGDTAQAVHYDEALALFEQLGDLGGVAQIWNNIGAEAFFEGRWRDAIDAYRRSRTAELRAGDHVQAAISEANVAELLVNQGRLDEAEDMLRNAIRVLRASAHEPATIFAETELARLWVRREKFEAAQALLEELYSRSDAAGEPMSGANTLLQLADAQLRQGRTDETMVLLERVEAAAGDIVGVFGPAIARTRAHCLAALGCYEEALSLIERGLLDTEQQHLIYDRALLLAAKVDVTRRQGAEPDAIDVHAIEKAFAELDIVEGSYL